MADPDVEARFQDFINQPGSQGSRLRDAFAQLLAQGQSQAVPMEAVMAQQGRAQLPPPPPNPHLDRPQIYSDDSVGTPADECARASRTVMTFAQLLHLTLRTFPRTRSSAIEYLV